MALKWIRRYNEVSRSAFSSRRRWRGRKSARNTKRCAAVLLEVMIDVHGEEGREGDNAAMSAKAPSSCADRQFVTFWEGVFLSVVF